MPTISLITYCRGRRNEAEQYVPAALAALSDCDELVFVDYDDPAQSGRWVQSLGDPRSTVVRVCGYEWFWANHARNLGGLAAAGDIVVFSDVDFLVSPELVRELRCLPLRSFYIQPRNIMSWGFVGCLRADFLEVQGWEEAFVGYGCDDLHFHSCLIALGRTPVEMCQRLVPVERDGEQVRVHQAAQTITAAYNARLSKILRMMHRYKMNISRNWGKGGQFLCRSDLAFGGVHAATDAGERAGDRGLESVGEVAPTGRLCL